MFGYRLDMGDGGIEAAGPLMTSYMVVCFSINVSACRTPATTDRKHHMAAFIGNN